MQNELKFRALTSSSNPFSTDKHNRGNDQKQLNGSNLWHFGYDDSVDKESINDDDGGVTYAIDLGTQCSRQSQVQGESNSTRQKLKT
jgi:hypothetical protein